MAEPMAIRVDLQRGSIIGILVGLPLLLLLGGLAASIVFDGKSDMTTRFIGGFFAVLFTVPALLILVFVRRILQKRGLDLDAGGVHYWQGGSRTSLPWDTIAAIGVGYEEPPQLPKIFIEDAIRDKLVDAVIDRRRRLAVEIFPIDPAAVAKQAMLARYRREGPAPRPGLPQVRWRVPMAPFGRLAARLEEGVKTFQPARWIGWFARPWRALPRG